MFVGGKRCLVCFEGDAGEEMGGLLPRRRVLERAAFAHHSRSLAP